MKYNFLNSKEVCDLLRISPNVLARAKRENLIEYFRFGRNTRFTEEGIDAFINKSKVK